MAVYTEIPDDEFDAFMKSYDLGQVLSCKGIAEGVENSNFLVVTEAGQFILTLYEKRVAPEDLPFFLGFMEHLARKKIACPTPLHDRAGRTLNELAGRPAAIITFLAGMWPRRITPKHCAELGQAPRLGDERVGVTGRAGTVGETRVELTLGGGDRLAVFQKPRRQRPQSMPRLDRALAQQHAAFPFGPGADDHLRVLILNPAACRADMTRHVIADRHAYSDLRRAACAAVFHGATKCSR